VLYVLSATSYGGLEAAAGPEHSMIQLSRFQEHRDK
jgi:hypothetical protein